MWVFLCGTDPCTCFLSLCMWWGDTDQFHIKQRFKKSQNDETKATNETLHKPILSLRLSYCKNIK